MTPLKTPLLTVLLTTAVLAGCGEAADPASPDGETAAASGAPRARLDESGLPLLRAGLWETTERRDGVVSVQRSCRAAGVEKEVRDLFFAPAEPGCVKTGAAVTNGRSVSVQCERAGLKVGLKLRFSGSETRFSATMETSETTTDGGTSREIITGESQWLSTCPAGLEPGDEVPRPDA